MTVASLSGIDAEAIEFRVDEESRICGRALKDVNFPKGGLVGMILRKREIVMPRGEDHILPGDDVIVFSLPEAIPAIEKLFD